MLTTPSICTSQLVQIIFRAHDLLGGPTRPAHHVLQQNRDQPPQKGPQNFRVEAVRLRDCRLAERRPKFARLQRHAFIPALQPTCHTLSSSSSVLFICPQQNWKHVDIREPSSSCQ